ncbi:MAG: preprotein translocase subunit YajC [Candidatus Omnitrophica bacterium]|nr:preprotein translocase subunit YajC [Candidatus Omnitrophota bacterium]
MFESIAYAADSMPGTQAAVSPLVSMVPFVLIFGIFYFLMIRPSQKKQQEAQKMVSELKKGDRVVTIGGVIGVITSLQNDYVVLKVGENENTKIEILKSAVSGLRQE